MNKPGFTLIAAMLLVAVQGCSIIVTPPPVAKPVLPEISMGSLSADQIQLTSSFVTNGGTGPRFESKPMTAIPQSTTHYIMNHVHWDPVTQGAGRHDVVWNWYNADNKQVATRTMNFNFDKTPYQFWYKFPAAGLNVGRYRVETMIDQRLISTTNFDVTL